MSSHPLDNIFLYSILLWRNQVQFFNCFFNGTHFLNGQTTGHLGFSLYYILRSLIILHFIFNSMTYLEFRICRKLEGIRTLHLPCGSLTSNSGHQAWQQGLNLTSHLMSCISCIFLSTKLLYIFFTIFFSIYRPEMLPPICSWSL